MHRFRVPWRRWTAKAARCQPIASARGVLGLRNGTICRREKLLQRLILLRHGKAESVAESGGDFERGLTERGRRDAALIGRVLADAGITPDLALVSAARRARETWDEASPAFPHARCESSYDADRFWTGRRETILRLPN